MKKMRGETVLKLETENPLSLRKLTVDLDLKGC